MGKHVYKNYNQLIKDISKNDEFSIKKVGRKNTFIITHISSGDIRTVHPGEKACKPLKNWIKKYIS